MFTKGLALLFIAFKLAGIIDWSWWWVLSPLWIYILLFTIWRVLASIAEYDAGK